MNALVIRPARPADSAALARLGNGLARATGVPTTYTAEMFERHAFGPGAQFEVLVAEMDGEVAGYALFEEAFNTDLCEPALWLHDVMVRDDARRGGIGRRLMAAVARIAVERGRTSVWWSVLSSNAAARRFYAALGARDEDVRLLELDGDALRALAGGGV